MKKPLLFICLVILCSFTNDCGEYRFDYKILIDPTGWPLLNKQAKAKTLKSLIAIKRPVTLGKQRTPFETWKVTITAWIVMVGEEEDRDFHLVLTNDSRTDSLIAEIPDPTCDKLKHFPALREKYSKAREFIEENIGELPSSVIELDEPMKVKITGFLFFDKIAHGLGHADNGIEIHPVIGIKKAS